MSRLNRSQRFDVLPGSTPGLLERVGLTADQTADAAWFVDAAGGKARGAAAIAAVCAQIGGLFYPLALLYRVPGLRQLADFAYRWVANNRYRLPGSTAACAVPPANSPNKHL